MFFVGWANGFIVNPTFLQKWRWVAKETAAQPTIFLFTSSIVA